MIDNSFTIPTFKVTGELKMKSESIIAREFPLTVIYNNVELVTLLCTPTNPDYLAVGFLFAEGFIKNKDVIKRVSIDEKKGIVRIAAKEDDAGFTRDLLFKRLITSACGRGAAFYSTTDAQNLDKVESKTKITSGEVFSLVDKFDEQCCLYKKTGGVHSAALCDNSHILVMNDDLGRHNAIDKVFGECILKGIPTEDRILITSGRIPSEMIVKAAKGKVPILLSVGATTDLGVRLANDLGITLIGFVREGAMTVYTNEWRLV